MHCSCSQSAIATRSAGIIDRPRSSVKPRWPRVSVPKIDSRTDLLFSWLLLERPLRKYTVRMAIIISRDSKKKKKKETRIFNTHDISNSLFWIRLFSDRSQWLSINVRSRDRKLKETRFKTRYISRKAQSFTSHEFVIISAIFMANIFRMSSADTARPRVIGQCSRGKPVKSGNTGSTG